MGRIANEKCENRSRQSGGRYPTIATTLTSLTRIFKDLNRTQLTTNQKESFFVSFIYLWFTGELARMRKQDKSAKISDYDLPDLYRLRGHQACERHAFRTVMHGKTSWVEYALGYPTKNGAVYLWQPVPARFNAFFQRFISKKGYERPFLSEKGKSELKAIIEKRWKYHGLHELEHAVARKDNLINYFNVCIANDNLLSALPRFVLLHQARHHKSARFYQTENSDRIRAKIFNAHNRYIDRLIEGIHEFGWKEKFTYVMKAKNNQNTEHHHFIDASITLNMPKELKQNTIPQLSYHQGHSKPTSTDTPILIGSQRMAAVPNIKRLFNTLHDEINTQSPSMYDRPEAFIAYFNLCTYHLALTFILCTGARPTHHISIEQARHFMSKKATIKDKGRYREILINEHLARQISHYRRLKRRLKQQVPKVNLDLRQHGTPALLWHLIDGNRQAVPVNASLLNQFLEHHNAPFDAYSLRHAFAQYALVSIDVRLTNSQLDRLLGHATMGEDLGNDNVFPLHRQQLVRHLNALTVNFQLKDICYDRVH